MQVNHLLNSLGREDWKDSIKIICCVQQGLHEKRRDQWLLNQQNCTLFQRNINHCTHPHGWP